MAKIQISIDDRLLEKVEAYVAENYQNRSLFFQLAAVEYLKAREAMTVLRHIQLSLNKIAESNNIDAESIAELDDLNRLLRMVYGKKA